MATSPIASEQRVVKSKQSLGVPYCLHFVHMALHFPWHLLLKELPFFVAVISSSHAAARDLCKHDFFHGANPGEAQQVALSW